MRMVTRWSLAVISPILAIALSGAASASIGFGEDFMAAMTSGSITSVTGTFPVVTNMTTTNPFSLQINTSLGYGEPLCNGAANPSICYGWQQFVYNSSNGTLSIQHFLYLYGSPACPNSSWTHYSDGHCELLQFTAPNFVPLVPIANLGGIKIVGSTGGGVDTVQFTYNGTTYPDYSQPTVFALSQWWNAAEVNIFGTCCGTVLFVNSGALVGVNISLTSTATSSPYCRHESSTGEQNNMSLNADWCCSVGGDNPGITFFQNYNATPTYPFCLLRSIEPLRLFSM
jgi:hypothetical protein